MSCNHLSDVDPDKTPRVDGVCEDCMNEGTTWVSLRVCKTCGHVGCCDSSPRKHARSHYEKSGHPIMGPANAQHGDWLWCYADNAYVDRDAVGK